MMKSNINLIGAATILGIGLTTGSAQALTKDFAYMSLNGWEPWGTNSNLDAMNAAFGVDNWDRINFDDAFSSYKMLYVDGGDGTAYDFVSFLNANRTELESYVLGGGGLFLNAATWYQSSFELVFDVISTEGGIGYSYYGNAVNGANPLFADAGTSWSGSYFAHNWLSDVAGFDKLITGDSGQTILAGGSFGSGYVLLGGQTSTFYHQAVDGSDPFQLRVNQLKYVAYNANNNPNPEPEKVPEPASVLGLLVVGALGASSTLKRKQKQLAE
jgi:hypothetical protein